MDSDDKLKKILTEVFDEKMKGVLKEIDGMIEKKLIDNNVIFDKRDMEAGKKYFVYTSPEVLFLKCMHCLESIKANERYVIIHYSEALKINPEFNRWTRANARMPHNCVGCRQRIKMGDEIVLLHEKHYDEMIENAKKRKSDKSPDSARGG